MSNSGKWEDAVAWLISQPDRQEFVKACYYDQPTSLAAKRYESSDEWKSALNWLPAKQGKSLDIGAGNGIVTYALAKAGWSATALEPDPSELVGAGAIRNLASMSNLDVRVVQEFGERMPFEDGEFDLVYARQVMHHAHDLTQFCAEVSRVLAPGGTFIGSREHVISSAKQLPAFLDSHPLHKLYGGENAFTLKQYVDAMTSARLQIKKILRPFDSPMNYAPQTRDSIAKELQARIRKVPLGFIPASVLSFSPILSLSMSILSQIDNRPGRVFSFVATKLGSKT